MTVDIKERTRKKVKTYERNGQKYTAEEREYIESKWGEVSIRRIAQRLNRSQGAILKYAERYGLGGVYNNGCYLTPHDISKMFGVDSTIVKSSWIKNHGLISIRSPLRNSFVHRIKLDDLLDWCKNNQSRWSSLNLEIYALGTEPDWLKEKRRRDLSNGPRKVSWSLKEEKLLMKLVSEGMKFKDIAIKLGRTEGSCRRRRFMIIEKSKSEGNSNFVVSRKRIIWTAEDEELLMKLFEDGLTFKEIAAKLGRTMNACITKRATILKNTNMPNESTASPRIKTWTEEEEELLMKLYSEGMVFKEISAKLGRTEIACIMKKNKILKSSDINSKSIPLTRTISWTIEEEELLMRLYRDGVTFKEIATKMGRTVQACRNKKNKILKASDIYSKSIPLTRTTLWTTEEEELLMRLYRDGVTFKEIATKMGRTVQACRDKKNKILKKIELYEK